LAGEIAGRDCGGVCASFVGELPDSVVTDVCGGTVFCGERIVGEESSNDGGVAKVGFTGGNRGIACAAQVIATHPFGPSTVPRALEITVLDVG